MAGTMHALPQCAAGTAAGPQRAPPTGAHGQRSAQTVPRAVRPLCACACLLVWATRESVYAVARLPQRPSVKCTASADQSLDQPDYESVAGEVRVLWEHGADQGPAADGGAADPRRAAR